MLIKFSVSNFRSFFDETTLDLVAINKLTDKKHHIRTIHELPILKTAGIYGSNGSGKTSLFKAIEFVKNIIIDQEFIDSIEFDKCYETNLLINNNIEPSKFNISFTINNSFYEYFLQINKTEILHEKLIEIKYPGSKKEKIISIFERKPDTFLYNKDIFEPQTIKLLKIITTGDLFKNKSILSLNGIFFKSKLIGEIRNWFEDKVKFLYPFYRKMDIAFFLYSKKEHLDNINMIIKYAKVGIESIDIVSYKPNIYFGRNSDNDKNLILEKLEASKDDHYSFIDEEDNLCSAIKKLNNEVEIIKVVFSHRNNINKLVPLDLSKESRGIQSFINLIPALLSSFNNGVTYFIDEIGVSIHPILMHKILYEYFKNNLEKANGQFIYNSHLTYLMDQKISRRDELWVITNTSRGSKLEPISKFGGIRQDENISNKYILGKYGGTPFEYEPGPLSLTYKE